MAAELRHATRCGISRGGGHRKAAPRGGEGSTAAGMHGRVAVQLLSLHTGWKYDWLFLANILSDGCWNLMGEEEAGFG